MTAFPFFSSLLDWAEVWALLVPLYMVVARRRHSPVLQPVKVYLWAALLLNVLADVIGDFKEYLPAWAQSNNPLYNIHSVVRFACFSLFFILLEQPNMRKMLRFIPMAMVVFLLVNFAFFENFFNGASLSGSLLTVESYLLLIYCMLYYLLRLHNESENILRRPDFWIVTGLGMYVVINFFIFLFYEPMLQQNRVLAVQMWNIHNVAFIIFCILTAKAFYVPHSNRY